MQSRIEFGRMVVDRKGGPKQVTYNGWPLYRYAKDRGVDKEGLGENLKQFGGEWHLVTSSGEPSTGQKPAEKK